MLAAAFALGYVLGAKAGHERYEQIRSAFAKVMGDPRVQEVVTKVEDTVMNRYNDGHSANGHVPDWQGSTT